jgi:hypothetical protein
MPKTIKYTKEFSYHGFSEWIGIEESIDDNQDEKEQLLILRQKLIDTFNQVLSEKNVPVIEKKEVKVSDEVQLTIDAINACAEIEGENGLKSYWLKSKTNLTLAKVYADKLKQLQTT